MKKKILMIDDHLVIIEGYKSALKFGFANNEHGGIDIDFATNFKDAISKIRETKKSQLFDVIILDLSIPTCDISKMGSGEELGSWIRQHSPKSKLLVITGYGDNGRIKGVLEKLNPLGFLLKNETSSTMEIVDAVKHILNNQSFYSPSVSKVLKSQRGKSISLDYLNIKILQELSNGTKTIELPNYVPLSLSGINKRKNAMKRMFEIDDDSDRALIIAAKNKGYI